MVAEPDVVIVHAWPMTGVIGVKVNWTRTQTAFFAETRLAAGQNGDGSVQFAGGAVPTGSQRTETPLTAPNGATILFAAAVMCALRTSSVAGQTCAPGFAAVIVASDAT